MLKNIGVNNIVEFDFIDPPPAETMMKAVEQLYTLGAINDEGDLTKLGRRMAEFPTDPFMARAILYADTCGCVSEVVTICSLLSVSGAVFYRPKEK